MNAANPAAIPGDFAPPVPQAKRETGPPVHLARLLAGLALATGIFDLCFWHIDSLGLSLAVFSFALAGIILGNREASRRRRTAGVILILLAGAGLASAIETGVTNSVVLIALVVVLAGHTFFTGTDSIWGRWLSQGVALVFAPGRIFWLAARLMEAAFQGGVGSIKGIIGGFLLFIPALVLALVFGSLLASGNAVFGAWTSNFFDWFWNELARFFDAGRITLWLVAAFLILPLLRPSLVSERWWRWTERMPRLPEIVPAHGAFLSSGLVLLVLNLMFFVANLADARFLWSGQSVPPGVTYSEYVHSGTNALIATVILSALVLTFIFQQSLTVARRRELKILAYLWIAQNLFLLTSVALRLKLYIQAYDMTVLRLGVIIFLVLVAVGFALLAIKIWQDRSLSWLIEGCVLAAFATLYLSQFLDLGGWSANYNVAQWEKDRTRDLDLYYLYDQGPAGWPALRRAMDDGALWKEADGRYLDVTDPLASARQNEESAPRAQFDGQHWREFSFRAYLNRRALEEKPNP